MSIKLDAELKKIYLKDGSHVGYMIIKATLNGNDLSVSLAPLFKTTNEANEYLKNIQKKINNMNNVFEKNPFKKREDRLKDLWHDLFGDRI